MGRLTFRTPGFAPRLLVWLALISLKGCQLRHLLSPLGGEQVNYYPTSELKGIVSILVYKGKTFKKRRRRVAKLSWQLAWPTCLCCGSEVADRSRREGGIGWQQMAVALAEDHVRSSDRNYVYSMRYEEPTLFVPRTSVFP